MWWLSHSLFDRPHIGQWQTSEAAFRLHKAAGRGLLSVVLPVIRLCVILLGITSAAKVSQYVDSVILSADLIYTPFNILFILKTSSNKLRNGNEIYYANVQVIMYLYYVDRTELLLKLSYF